MSKEAPAIYSLRLKALGTDVCEVCFLRMPVFQRRKPPGQFDQAASIHKVCIECAVIDMNKDCEAGKKVELRIKEKLVPISHVGKGGRPGELLLYERIDFEVAK